MNKQLIRMVPVVAAVALFQGGIERKGSFDITEATFAPDAKVLVTEALERKGSFDLTKKGSFDTQGKDPEVPVSPNFADRGVVVVNGKDPEMPVDPKLLSTPVEKKGSFDITERIMAGSGTGKGGDVPVTPGLSKRGVGGTDKGGEVPVTPGLNKPSASGTSKGGDVPVVTG